MNIELLSLPFIGAFIGYFTNYVAIKMLFLPKKAYFVFGVRVPFTPGLIPKKRTELIEKISDVVSSKVVNKKDIIKYIYKKKNRAFLYEFSKNLIDSLLLKRVSELYLDYNKMEEKIFEYLCNNLDTFIRNRFDKFDIDIDYFVYNAFLSIDFSKPLKNYVSNDKVLKIKNMLDSLSVKALNKLAASMDSPEIRKLVKEKIKEAMDRYADDSNVLIASFISMASPLIEDNEKIVDTIIKEMASLLTDEITIKKVSDNIYLSVEQEFLNGDVKHVLKAIGFDSPDNVRVLVNEKVKELFGQLSVKEKIVDSAINSIDKKVLAKEIVDGIRRFADDNTFLDIINVLKPDVVEKLPSMAVNNLLYVIKKESEMIFNFDIAKIAKEKLDKLDIEDIEDVVLNISKDQFRYINIFGGILGFIIGLTEIALNMLHFN